MAEESTSVIPPRFRCGSRFESVSGTIFCEREFAHPPTHMARVSGHRYEWGDPSHSSSVAFTLSLDPVPKGRHRTGQGRTYTPKRTRDYEAAVWNGALAAGIRPGMFPDGPVMVDIVFVIRHRDKRLWGKWCWKRPDGDNLEKAVFDGLAPLWGDDAQIAHHQTSKVYGPSGEVAIKVRRLDA